MHDRRVFRMPLIRCFICVAALAVETIGGGAGGPLSSGVAGGTTEQPAVEIPIVPEGTAMRLARAWTYVSIDDPRNRSGAGFLLLVGSRPIEPGTLWSEGVFCNSQRHARQTADRLGLQDVNFVKEPGVARQFAGAIRPSRVAAEAPLERARVWSVPARRFTEEGAFWSVQKLHLADSHGYLACLSLPGAGAQPEDYFSRGVFARDRAELEGLFGKGVSGAVLLIETEEERGDPLRPFSPDEARMLER